MEEQLRFLSISVSGTFSASFKLNTLSDLKYDNIVPKIELYNDGVIKDDINFIDDEKYNVPGSYPVGHTGGAYGLNSIMIWSPADNWGIVAMTNGYTDVEGKSFLKTLTNAIYNACIKE